MASVPIEQVSSSIRLDRRKRSHVSEIATDARSWSVQTRTALQNHDKSSAEHLAIAPQDFGIAFPDDSPDHQPQIEFVHVNRADVRILFGPLGVSHPSTALDTETDQGFLADRNILCFLGIQVRTSGLLG